MFKSSRSKRAFSDHINQVEGCFLGELKLPSDRRFIWENQRFTSKLAYRIFNNLNQYTQRTVPAVIDVTGSAATNATVTVNDQLVDSRKNEYFYKQLSVTNSSAVVYLPVNVVGVKNQTGTNDVVTIESGTNFVAKTPEVFVHDGDGNLTQNGRFTHTFDGENRLTVIEGLTNIVVLGRKIL